ncbi:MAG TPA: hypothetical protein VJ932_03515 [Alkalispirochaeta sp.]|nr:hypothetical protein [Alkalispirochaeta sp.]
MAVENYLTTSPLHEIVRYREEHASTRGVSYRGAVRNHPYDSEKFLIITSPEKDGSHFYEFRTRDVCRVEDVSQLVTEEGETIQIVEVSVREGSVGIEMKPFEVR